MRIEIDGEFYGGFESIERKLLKNFQSLQFIAAFVCCNVLGVSMSCLEMPLNIELF